MLTFLPAVFLFLVLLVLPECVIAQCNGLCCEGRNHSCGYTKRYKDTKIDRCFCDEACKSYKDCCSDFIPCIKAVDCVIKDSWSKWNKCSSNCDRGTQQRFKKVSVASKGNGKSCPLTSEVRGCSNFIGCNRGFFIPTFTNIIPIGFKKWNTDKRYDKCKDIRQYSLSAFSHCKHKTVSYCAKLQIVDSRHRCQTRYVGSYNVHSKNLRVGNSICVECNQVDGQNRCETFAAVNVTSHWNAIVVPGCHGKWVAEKEIKKCSCDITSHLAFLLV